MSDLTTQLKECIKPFQFGKLDLLDRMNELRISTCRDGLAIENWYDYGLVKLHGDCSELLVKAYRKLREISPDLDIKCNWGYDGEVFNEFVGPHAFLTVKEKRSSQRILVDPGLQRVEPFEDSCYQLDREEDEDSIQEKIRKLRAPLIIFRDNGTFLGFDQRTNLAYYIGRNLQGFTDDVLIITTYKIPPPEVREVIPVDKRVFPISPCPEEIRRQAPYFELAYQLERHAKKCLSIQI